MSNLFWDGGPVASGRKVCLATTSYDNPDASYTFSIARTREAMHQAGIPTAYLLLQGNCHVDDARNTVVQHFLLSDCTDLVFLDADVSWEPENLIELCRYDRDIVGGVYPFRREGSKGNMPVRMLPGVLEPDGGLLEVEGLPTGFMRIKRHVLEKLCETANHFTSRTELRSQIPILFERSFETGNRWGGDLNFCRKWRAMGGRVHAAYEMRLGHTAKTVIRDGLGAALRRQRGGTLRHLADSLRAGSTDLGLLTEARYAHGNEYAALEDVLSLCALVKADGPILEAGSGLTTIVLAAAHPDQTVWCIEHDPAWAARVEQMALEAGTRNIAIVTAKIRHGWYDLGDDLKHMPARFSLGLNDGPPRIHGSRMGFFSAFGANTDTIIVDDADDPGYRGAIEDWCVTNRRTVDFVEERGALIRKAA